MSGVCSLENAEDNTFFFRGLISYMDLTCYVIRLAMGLSVTLYLVVTRKDRKFPRFVILQLLLIDLEYLLAVGVESWAVQ